MSNYTMYKSLEVYVHLCKNRYEILIKNKFAVIFVSWDSRINADFFFFQKSMRPIRDIDMEDIAVYCHLRRIGPQATTPVAVNHMRYI